MRTVLVGTVDSSLHALGVMIREGFAPAAVVTLPVDKAIRHADFVDLRPLAATAAVPVIEAANINAPAVLERLREIAPEYLMVIGWSQICREEILALPTHGALGFHPSLLPQNRGRAVIPWTILQGLSETGTTLFWLDEGMDTGDILAQERFAVSPDETAASLYARHLDALEEMLRTVLPRMAAHDAPRVPQRTDGASYCARRTAADGLIDWNAPADAVWTLVRAAGRPYPGAFTFNGGGRLRIWAADHVGEAPYWGLPGQVQAIRPDGTVLVQCGDRQHVLLKEVQPEGGAVGPAADHVRIHERLGIPWLDIINRFHG